MIMNGCTDKPEKLFGLIPNPSQLKIKNGTIELEGAIGLRYDRNDTNLSRISKQLSDRLADHGIKVSGKVDQVPILSLSKILPAQDDDPETYTLSISDQGIQLQSAGYAGLYYGLETFYQLLTIAETSDKYEIPFIEIEDTPRFKWRGMHLDVARHFFPTEFIKRYIDLIAMHKMNIFHWHLTEDQGWRIAIKQYPKLQKISAWRNETLVGHYRDKPHQFDGKRYGGYYTQKEIRDIISYATDRYVTVVPEIEMPGHATAALSAYPELSCTGGPHEVETIWGVHKEVFCAGKEETFKFLENVLKEVSGIFPGPYIHIGGDECPKDRWKDCNLCQARIRSEGLKNEHELQSYFIKRIEGILDGYGKRLIGWDEILEGGLAPKAIVQSWRGMDGGIQAANADHQVIMSPTTYAYFDYYQSEDNQNEPLAIGGYLPLEKVYDFEPVPNDIDPDKRHLILGGQANLWTEYIRTPEQAEYMAVPRMCAMAEVLWSPRSKKDYNDFFLRMVKHTERLDRMGINYRKLDQ